MGTPRELPAMSGSDLYVFWRKKFLTKKSENEVTFLGQKYKPDKLPTHCYFCGLVPNLQRMVLQVSMEFPIETCPNRQTIWDLSYEIFTVLAKRPGYSRSNSRIFIFQTIIILQVFCQPMLSAVLSPIFVIVLKKMNFYI